MKLSVISLFFVSLWTQCSGFFNEVEARGLVFNCELGSTGEIVPMLFDTNPVPLSASDSRRIYELLVDFELLPRSPESTDIVERSDTCLLHLNTDSVSLSTRSYQIGSSVFSVTALSRDSYFSQFSSFGVKSYPRLGTEFMVRDSSDLSDDTFGCSDIISMKSGTDWTVSLDSLALLVDSTYIPIDHSEVLRARLSPLNELIGLPANLWTQFVSSVLTHPDLSAHESEGRIIVNDCELLAPSSLPELVVNGARVWGPALLHDLGNGTCMLEVYATMDNIVILGAPFFKLGYVQLSRSGMVDLCPSRGSDPIVSSAVVSSSASKSSGQNAIWIGVTIGGFCLIVLVTFALVYRSIRKNRASKPQDCPNRAMIHDLSVDGSSVAGSIPTFDV